MGISVVKLWRIKENTVKHNNCFGFSHLSRKAGTAARLHALTRAGILLLFPCSSLLFPLGDQRKGCYLCSRKPRELCRVLGLDWLLGMAAASQVRSSKSHGADGSAHLGGDELEKAAKGLLRFIYEGVTFLSPLPKKELLRSWVSSK